MKDVKLYTVNDTNSLSGDRGEPWSPLQAGAAIADTRFDKMLHDDDGVNISQKYRLYREFTAQYWIWKNSHSDYVGLFYNGTKFELGSDWIDIAAEKGLLDRYDCILPTLSKLSNGENVRDLCCDSLGIPGRVLDFIICYIEKRYPDISASAKRYLSQEERFINHCSVLKRALFDECSSFVFDLLHWYELLDCPRNLSAETNRIAYEVCCLLCEFYYFYLLEGNYAALCADSTVIAEDNIASFAKGAHRSRLEKISFGDLTRGDGKLFCELSSNVFDGGLSTRSFEVSSATSSGIAIPAKVVLREGKAILVLQVIDSDQKASVVYRDQVGEIRARGSHTFSALSKKL